MSSFRRRTWLHRRGKRAQGGGEERGGKENFLLTQDDQGEKEGKGGKKSRQSAWRHLGRKKRSAGAPGKRKRKKGEERRGGRFSATKVPSRHSVLLTSRRRDIRKGGFRRVRRKRKGGTLEPSPELTAKKKGGAGETAHEKSTGETGGLGKRGGEKGRGRGKREGFPLLFFRRGDWEEKRVKGFPREGEGGRERGEING